MISCAAAVAAYGHAGRILAIIRSNTDFRSSLTVGLFILVLPVLLVLLSGACRATRGRGVVLILAVSIIPILLVTSGQVLPGLATVLVFVPACLATRVAVERLLRCASPFDTWVLGGIIGLGLMGVVTAALGSVGLVGWRSTWLVALVLLALALLAGRDIMRRDLADGRVWLRETTPVSWLQRFQIGLLIGISWLTLFSALVPEISPDAVTHRLPSAAYVAESGRLATNPDLLIPLRPGLSELLYAAVYTVGGLEATKLISLIAGWLSILGVAAIARHLGGPCAMVPSALALASLPLMLWTLESASADVFSVAFALGAGLLVVQPDALRWRSALLAAVCVVLGLLVKASFAIVTVGFVVVAPLLVIRLHRVRARTMGGVLTGMVGAVCLVAVVAMNLGGIGRALEPLHLGGSGWVSIGDQVSSFQGRFRERTSLLSFLTAPIDLTFKSARYPGTSDGAVGYLVLALVPLVFLARWNTSLIRCIVVVLAASIVWYWFIQYVRFALPIAALLCALCGVAAAQFHRAHSRWLGMVLRGSVPLLAMLGLTGYLLATLTLTGLPWRTVLGVDRREVFLSRFIVEHPALSLLNAEPGKKLAAVNSEIPPQIYSQTAMNALLQPLTWRLTSTPLQDARTLLHILDLQGYTHLVINQGAPDFWWVNNVGGDPSFLRANTTLVGGARGVYVYRLLPPEQRGQETPWTRAPELFANGEFEVNGDGVLPGWSSTGIPGPVVRTDDTSTAARRSVRSRPGDELVTTVMVTPRQEYLLSLSVRSASERGWSQVFLDWLDETGHPISHTIENFAATSTLDREWWMLATAPANATRAKVRLLAINDEIWFSHLSMRARNAP